MDSSIKNIFEETLSENLINVIISNSTNRNISTKVKIRPVIIKNEINYQVSDYIGEKVFHQNYSKAEILELLSNWFAGLFRQAEIITTSQKVTILISKKGKATIIKKSIKDQSTTTLSNVQSSESDISDHLLHNKSKNYILKEGKPLPFLIDLGVMTQEGMVVKAKSDKFKQINRFLEFIEDVLPYLDKSQEQTILDFGCGKSYLTFAMYYYLKVLKGYQIKVVGLDLKTDVIKHCNELSLKYGFDSLHFLEGDIASYQGNNKVDMVVTLHACDTATDYALYKAVTWGAQVILSVPCCQHELNKQIHNQTLKPILKYGIVKERMAALATDAIRAELLETKGYKVQLLEFIDMEHTPKNILIRAVRKKGTASERNRNEKELTECIEFLGASPCLLRLFQEETIEEGK